MDENTKIFALYMLEDKEVLLNLSSRLDVLDKANSLSFWGDEPIHPKQRWIPQNESRLKDADVFLFLLSNAFMHSEFIKQIEFKNIIDRYKEGNTKVVPVLINDCPWDIDFRADDYNFNFNELQVLPEERKPMENWDSLDEAYTRSATSLKRIIAPHLDAIEEEAYEVEGDEDTTIISNSEEQIAINFSAENEAKKIAEEEKRISDQAAQEKIAKEELRFKEEIKAKKRVEKELKIKEEEAKRIANEKKVSEEIESKRIAALEQKRLEEAEAVRLAEKAQNEWEESEYETDDLQSEKNIGTKKKALIGALVAILLLAGIFLFSGGENDNLEQDAPILPETDAIVQKDSTPAKSTIIEANSEPKILSAGANVEKLTVGERYDSGIIFEIDGTGNSGKIVHYDDAGPMTWNEAMKIHEQLGEGWRVPTFEELKQMYKIVGQGANNEGEFADELYWSATPYDENQAKMVRFRDGNTSYHYNSKGTHRRYLVRAIRDFSR